jgi:hypothetical protein
MSYDEYAEDDEVAVSEDSYRVTRLLLSPEYRELPPDQVEAILASTFPGMTPEDAENFFRDVGRAFNNVGRTVAQNAPGILSGAMQGATTGAVLGPWGILGGAVTGGVAGGLSSAARRPPGPAPVVPQPSPGVPGPGVAGAVTPPMGGGAASATQQLLSLLAQPQTWQALLAATLGRTGRSTLPTGTTPPVPVSSILNALGTLATRAAEELSVEQAEGESVPAYLMDAEGEYMVDLADADARASHLLRVLSEANEAMVEYDEDYEYDEDDEDYEYDEDDEDYEYDEDDDY